MDPRLVSTIFVALGFADLAMMNFVLAPRLAADEARSAVSAPAITPPACPPSPGVPVPVESARAAVATEAAVAAEREPVVTGPAAPDVLFHFDGQRLAGGEATAELRRVGLALRDAPQRRLLLRGHADRLGSPGRNLALSRLRAEAVERYLVEVGAPRERIEIEAVGDVEPVDPGDTPGAWAKNRRVQVFWK